MFPRSNIGRRDVRRRASVPDELQRAYDKVVMDLLDFKPDGDEPMRLVLDEEALEPWRGFAEEIEIGQAEGGEYQDIRDWAAKLPGGVLRLADHQGYGVLSLFSFLSSADRAGKIIKVRS